jgi:sulfur carrier protein
MADALTLTLNGTERSFDDLGEQPGVSALVAALGFRADRVALELNGEILPRAEWPETPLKSGDSIELVHFVGGGTR